MELTSLLRGTRMLVAGGMLAMLLPLTGCPFFLCEGKADCGTATTAVSTTDSGDYVYVANGTTSVDAVNGYDLSTGSPVNLSDSPYTMTGQPTAMVIAPNNSLMFVALNTGIYAYTIAVNGAITINNGGVAVSNLLASAMCVSADGEYLYVLTATTTATTVTEYQIVNTAGGLGTGTPYSPAFTGVPTAGPGAMAVDPNGNFLVISLGSVTGSTGALVGDAIIPLASDLFNLTSYAVQYVPVPSATMGDYAVTVDSFNNIYIARTGQVVVYNVPVNGVATEVGNTTANSTTGNTADHSIVLSNSGANLYTANAAAANTAVSGFSVTTTGTTGVLGLLGGSPYPGPATASAVAADTTGKYLVVAGYGTGAVEEYAIGSGGLLTASSTTQSTGSTTGTTVIAVTH